MGAMDEEQPKTSSPDGISVENEPARAEAEAAAGKRRKFERIAVELTLSVMLGLTIVLFFFQPMGVDGVSMEPTLVSGERLFVNRYFYSREPVRKGDVVVFYSPSELRRSYVKRVVAVGGDCVELRQGYLFVNDEAVVEPYVTPENRDDQSYPRTCIAHGSFFALGDHRNHSNDSRVIGPVPEAYMYGRAVFAYWPLSRWGRLR